jgi:hypothetical protein
MANIAKIASVTRRVFWSVNVTTANAAKATYANIAMEKRLTTKTSNQNHLLATATPHLPQSSSVAVLPRLPVLDVSPLRHG